MYTYLCIRIYIATVVNAGFSNVCHMPVARRTYGVNKVAKIGHASHKLISSLLIVYIAKC